MTSIVFRFCGALGAIAGSLALLASMPTQAGAAESGSTAPAPTETAKPRMKRYFFVLLRSGPNRTQPTEEAERIQEGHMAHIRETASAGKLQIAGPFDDEDGDWRGILVYDTATSDEAKALCEADPAVKAGRLVCDIHGWWAQPGSTLR